MSCGKIEELLPGYVADELSDRERVEVESHLRTCDACTEALEAYEQIESMLLERRDLRPQASPTAAAVVRRVGLRSEPAWRALDEETPIEREWVKGIELLDLGEYNYVSPGSTNEQVWYTHADVELPQGVHLGELHDRVTGLEDHGERIVTSIHQFRRELFTELCNAADKLALLLILEKLHSR